MGHRIPREEVEKVNVGLLRETPNSSRKASLSQEASCLRSQAPPCSGSQRKVPQHALTVRVSSRPHAAVGAAERGRRRRTEGAGFEKISASPFFFFSAVDSF